MNMTIVWLVLLIVMVVIELATMGLTTIWFAGGSLSGNDCSGMFGTDLATGYLILCGIVGSVVVYKTDRRKVFQQGQDSDQCGSHGRKTGCRNE